MNHITIFKRTTHRYVDGWEHLDSHEAVAVLKALQPRTVDHGNGYDDGGTMMQTFIAPRPIRNRAERRLIAQALRDTLSGTRCQHEYDCCGCITRRARVVAASGRSFSVRVVLDRNY